MKPQDERLCQNHLGCKSTDVTTRVGSNSELANNLWSTDLWPMSMRFHITANPTFWNTLWPRFTKQTCLFYSVWSKMSDWAHASSRKMSNKVESEPHLSPSCGLEIECRINVLPHWLHFSDPEAVPMCFTVCGCKATCRCTANSILNEICQ